MTRKQSKPAPARKAAPAAAHRKPLVKAPPRHVAAAAKSAEPHKKAASSAAKAHAPATSSRAPHTVTGKAAAPDKARHAAPHASVELRRAGVLPEERQSQLKLLIARGKEQG